LAQTRVTAAHYHRTCVAEIYVPSGCTPCTTAVASVCAVLAKLCQQLGTSRADALFACAAPVPSKQSLSSRRRWCACPDRLSDTMCSPLRILDYAQVHVQPLHGRGATRTHGSFVQHHQICWHCPVRAAGHCHGGRRSRMHADGRHSSNDRQQPSAGRVSDVSDERDVSDEWFVCPCGHAQAGDGRAPGRGLRWRRAPGRGRKKSIGKRSRRSKLHILLSDLNKHGERVSDQNILK